MKYAKDGEFIVVKLEAEDDIIESLKDVISKENVKAGFVFSGIGGAHHVEVGALKGKTHVKEILEEQMEILSISGSVSEDDPILHLHISLAGVSHHAFGGHLFSGKAYPFAEIVIKRFDKIKMKRELNENSSFRELVLS
ncbi:PPC domain-containing DNA-binding protein [Cuniculiplasma sp. SKW3]|uniref:PPC domain-containing DNA-binding protein n=1 Tax=unclassified Cuniculiplasma TaxID=2619706 RepID=UPI003FD26B94